MAGWREIDSIRKQPSAFRDLAARLRVAHATDLTEWESDFLQSIASLKGAEEFSVRQAEKLLQIRDGHTIVTTWRGFSIKSLIQGCYELRLDLSEDDEAWILDRHSDGPTKIKLRSVGRLARISRQLGLIEENQDDEAA